MECLNNILLRNYPALFMLENYMKKEKIYMFNHSKLKKRTRQRSRISRLRESLRPQSKLTEHTVQTSLPERLRDSIYLKGNKMIRVDNGILKINNSFAVNLKELDYIGIDETDPLYNTVVIMDKFLIQTVFMFDIEQYPDFDTVYSEIESEWRKFSTV